MIVDGFIFYNELDLLELRLEELYPAVDKFVIVQADQTFRGQSKPYLLVPTESRWDEYSDKMVVVDLEMEDFSGPWEREAYQRNMLGEVLKDMSYYSPENILLISDADEIPRREMVVSLTPELLNRHPARLLQRAYYYSLNTRVGDEGSGRALLADDLTTAEEIRRSDPPTTIDNAGWHFSYLGDADWIRNKIKSFSHSELDKPEILWNIEEAMKNRADLFGRGSFIVEEVDDTWPVAVKNNPERWARYIWEQ